MCGGLVQILEYDLLGPHLLNLCRGHPAGQIIGCVGNHFAQFGLGDRRPIGTGERDIAALQNASHHTRLDTEVSVFGY